MVDLEVEQLPSEYKLDLLVPQELKVEQVQLLV
jgi:hypothetical protein